MLILTAYFVTLPQKEKNSLLKETVMLNQATMRKNKSLYDPDLIKFDSISGEISCTSKIDALNFEVGSLKLEVGSRKSEVGSRKSEVGSRKSEVGVGSEKSEVGSPSSAFVWKICGETFSPNLLRFVWRRHVGAPLHGHQHGDRKPAETSVTEFCCKNVNLSLEELEELFR